jgi:hypothetical protein
MGDIDYLESAERQFRYYKKLGEQAMEQLTEEQLFWQPNEDSNSVFTIVKHLWGNMMSRWINFLTEDGEKPWRQRDSEFENTGKTRQDLLKLWDEGWECLFAALNSSSDSELGKIVYIRNEGHTILDAINRQLAHYPYHVGQIIYIGKQVKSSDWKSLSIPRNKSADYNAGKFSREKDIRHFTDDLLKG